MICRFVFLVFIINDFKINIIIKGFVFVRKIVRNFVVFWNILPELVNNAQLLRHKKMCNISLFICTFKPLVISFQMSIVLHQREAYFQIKLLL